MTLWDLFKERVLDKPPPMLTEQQAADLNRYFNIFQYAPDGGSLRQATNISSLGIFDELKSPWLDVLQPTVFSQQAHQFAVKKTFSLAGQDLAANVTEGIDMAWDDGEDWGIEDVFSGIQKATDIYQKFGALRTAFGGGNGNGGLMTDSGDPVAHEEAATGGGEGGMVQTAGPMVAGAIWLGALLTRTFGRSMAGRVITGANGVRVRLGQLWPLVRRYGSQAVAGGLGISVGTLGGYLAAAAQTGATGRRSRGRGISARDVKTTRRTIKQLRSLTRMAGIGGGRSYRPRRGYYHWHKGRR